MKTQKSNLGSYLKRLIQRAVNNTFFENNLIGAYRIEPQHGVNTWKFNLYKDNQFLANFSIYETAIFGTMEKADSREQKEIFNTLKNLYKDRTIIMREVFKEEEEDNNCTHSFFDLNNDGKQKCRFCGAIED